MRLISTLSFVTSYIMCVTSYSQTSWNQPFKDCQVEGSITVYDYQKRQWMTNDPKDGLTPSLPASTFKIVNSLIVLDKGIIQDEHELISWVNDYDTLKYGHRPSIYHSMSISEAFSKSAVWVYVELAKKIGKDHYKEILNEINYGNLELSAEGVDFWNFGPFGISPVNQIEVLIDIYEETLPFSPSSYRALKRMMIDNSFSEYSIRAKTGWTRNEGKDIGWWVGYIEQSNEVYFFATRLTKGQSTSNPNFGSCRKEITIEILQKAGIL